MWYIYRQPEFYIPKEFQDWLVWAWTGKHNWTTVIDISWNWNHWTANWGVVLSRKNNAWMMSFDGVDDYVDVDIDLIPSWQTLSYFIFIKPYNLSWWTVFSDINPRNIIWMTTSDWPFIRLLWQSCNIWINDWTQWLETRTEEVFEENKTQSIWVIITPNNYTQVYKNWTLLNNSLANDIFSSSWQNWSKVIWKNWYYNNRFFDWQIFLILIYNKALSQSQIQKMYEFFRQWYYD